jgi:hypothetical protein
LHSYVDFMQQDPRWQEWINLEYPISWPGFKNEKQTHMPLYFNGRVVSEVVFNEECLPVIRKDRFPLKGGMSLQLTSKQGDEGWSIVKEELFFTDLTSIDEYVGVKKEGYSNGSAALVALEPTLPRLVYAPDDFGEKLLLERGEWGRNVLYEYSLVLDAKRSGCRHERASWSNGTYLNLYYEDSNLIAVETHSSDSDMEVFMEAEIAVIGTIDLATAALLFYRQDSRLFAYLGVTIGFLRHEPRDQYEPMVFYLVAGESAAVVEPYEIEEGYRAEIVDSEVRYWVELDENYRMIDSDIEPADADTDGSSDEDSLSLPPTD